MKRQHPLKRSPLKRGSFRRTKRAKPLRKRLWNEFRALILKRDRGCRMAGDWMLFGVCAGSLQGSHIFPKGAWPLLELYPLNVKILCYRHHRYVWPNRPEEMHFWLQKTLGEAWMIRLHQERVNHLSRKGMDEAAIRAEWKAYGLT